MKVRALVICFNECITRRDVDGLAALMGADHVFIDTVNNRVEGRAACVDAWRSFFAAFPDYRNEFGRIKPSDDGVAIAGRSFCSDARLDGPALWSARVTDEVVTEWRVWEDNVANRAALGL